MMRSTFFFSLLAGTAFALPAGNNLKARVDGLKPTSATPAEYGGYGGGYGQPTPAPNPIESLLPIAPIVSIVTSALGAIPSGFIPDNDLPAPLESVFIPVSELFNSAVAPAFTDEAKIPLLSLAPVYSSTPSASVAEPTGSSEYPEATPTVETTQPATSTTCTESKAQSTRVPLDATRSADLPPYPTGAASAVSASYPTGTGMRPSGVPYPTGTGRPGGFHGGRPQGGFGWGRPRPSGMWPHGYPRPTGGFHYPSKPSAASGPGGVKASSTPCTLETRVRPTPTALKL